MPSLTVENYLKAILQIGLPAGDHPVSTGQLAERLSVSPGTVTSMLKTLSDSGLADYRPYEGVRLTQSGQLLALRMLRRHRLIELFLVNTLDLTWDQVHEEAENMEHAVSDFLIDRIDEFLGRPDYDPHGDPIPAADGSLRGTPQNAVTLASCQAGQTVRFARVMNQDPEFLRFLTQAGLSVGSVANIEENSEAGGSIQLSVDGVTTSLGRDAATQLLVERTLSGATP